MIAEARGVRERIFADLTRRRDLARQQIETLQIRPRQIMASLRGPEVELDASLTGLEVHVTDDADEDTGGRWPRASRARRRSDSDGPRRRRASCSARWMSRPPSSSVT